MSSTLNTPEMVFAKDLTRRIRTEAPRPLFSWELIVTKGQKQTSWRSSKTGRNGAGPPHMVLTVSNRFVHAPQHIVNDIATQLSSVLRGEWGAGRQTTARIHAWSGAKQRNAASPRGARPTATIHAVRQYDNAMRPMRSHAYYVRSPQGEFLGFPNRNDRSLAAAKAYCKAQGWDFTVNRTPK